MSEIKVQSSLEQLVVQLLVVNLLQGALKTSSTLVFQYMVKHQKALVKFFLLHVF